MHSECPLVICYYTNKILIFKFIVVNIVVSCMSCLNKRNFGRRNIDRHFGHRIEINQKSNSREKLFSLFQCACQKIRHEYAIFDAILTSSLATFDL